MEKLYLPQDFTGILEEDLRPYEDRSTTAFAIGYTKNKQLEMKTGLQYRDSLNANLTVITWIEDSNGYYAGETEDQPTFDRIVKICTIYLDRGGFITEAFYKSFRYIGKIARQINMPSDARIEVKVKDVYNITRLFKSKGMELHKEIFLDKVIKIEGFKDVKINSKSIFFNLIKEVSIFNRCCDMTYVYAIAHEEKEMLEKIKKYVGVAALPFAISGGAFIKALQTSLGLVSYLCDIDSTFKFSDKLFEFKGPVVITDVILNIWKNNFTYREGTYYWGDPYHNSAYNQNDYGSKQDAIESFKELETILKI